MLTERNVFKLPSEILSAALQGTQTQWNECPETILLLLLGEVREEPYFLIRNDLILWWIT